MLTREQSDALKDYFPVQAHEFLKGTYISEEAITNRLDEVDPAWEFVRLEITRRDNRVVATYRLTVAGTSRDGVGMETIQYGKDKDNKPTDTEVNEAEKSAATDALKRAARLFGIGRYILEMKGVNNERSCEEWLAKRRGVNKETGEIKLVQNGTQSRQEAQKNDLAGSEHADPATSAKTPQERLGTPNGQRVGGTTFPMGDFKNRVLKEIYASNAIHMNKSLDKLIKAGLLNYDSMTLEQAYEVVRTRKEVDVPA